MNKKTPKITDDSSEKVEIARIGYRQAVIVAVIAALSAFLVAGIGGYFTFASKSNVDQSQITTQRFLTVHSIQGASNHFRLNIVVNGYTYVYPTKQIWADPLSLSLPISFPIVNGEEYSVYFWGFEKRNYGTSIFMPQFIDKVRFTGASESRTSKMITPFSVQYEIHE